MTVLSSIYKAILYFFTGALFKIPLGGGSTLDISLMILLLVPTGVYFMLRTKFMPIRMVPEMLRISLEKNEMTMTDAVENVGAEAVPFQMLYHFNVGYPLLTEHTELHIPATEVAPRNDHAATGIADCLKMEKPQNGYEEMCFYHKMAGRAEIKVYNPEVKKGFVMSYDTEKLPCFTEWKMMGEGEYVLGVEPGNAYPDGRDVMRAKGMLQMIAPGEIKAHSIKLEFLN